MAAKIPAARHEPSNLFDIVQVREGGEACEVLALGPDVRIERIVSRGHASLPGFWYDQDRDEWVCLLQGRARLAWENGGIMEFAPGDWVFIPAHARLEEASSG